MAIAPRGIHNSRGEYRAERFVGSIGPGVGTGCHPRRRTERGPGVGRKSAAGAASFRFPNNPLILERGRGPRRRFLKRPDRGERLAEIE